MPYCTPDDVRLKFEEEFLKTGSARRAATVAGIPERTGRGLAEKLEEDPDFLAARRRLHLHALDRAEAAVMRSIDLLAERIENGPTIVPGDDKRPPVIFDKSADNGKAVAALTDSLLRRRKMEDDVEARAKESAHDTSPVEVVIRVKQDEPAS
jgi:hypothetical protein